jgi:hypothetical protein
VTRNSSEIFAGKMPGKTGRMPAPLGRTEGYRSVHVPNACEKAKEGFPGSAAPGGSPYRRASMKIARNHRLLPGRWDWLQSGRRPAAQILNLLYRRIAFGRAFHCSQASGFSRAMRIANPRHSRVQLCATLVAAAARYALSPVFNRHRPATVKRFDHASDWLTECRRYQVQILVADQVSMWC